MNYRQAKVREKEMMVSGSSLAIRTVPADCIPQLLALWDESAHQPINRQNQSFTHGARLKWTARMFVAAHPGRMFGQGNVYLDLCVLLEEARQMARRLHGVGA